MNNNFWCFKNHLILYEMSKFDLLALSPWIICLGICFTFIAMVELDYPIARLFYSDIFSKLFSQKDKKSFEPQFSYESAKNTYKQLNVIYSFFISSIIIDGIIKAVFVPSECSFFLCLMSISLQMIPFMSPLGCPSLSPLSLCSCCKLMTSRKLSKGFNENNRVFYLWL